jgi:hypothetical protein
MKKKSSYVILGTECHPVWDNAVGYKAFEAATSMGHVWFGVVDGEVKDAHWTPAVKRGSFGPKKGIETIYFEAGMPPQKFARQIDAWLRALAKAGSASTVEAVPSRSRERPKRLRRRQRSRTSAA